MGTDPGALSGATIALSLSQQEVWLDQAAWPGRKQRSVARREKTKIKNIRR